MAGLRLEHIYKVYPNGTKAVSNFTMEIEDKEFIVFVGPSGCGKSTTLRMIAGLEDISAGELYIGDRIVNDVEPKDRDIAMVFQNYALYPHMTVYENMAFGLKLRHVPNEEIHEKVLWAAKLLGLTEYLDRKPKAMSGGQRQRVSLGRAILRNPKVMLLDEPLSNLDAKLRAQMRSEIAKLHESLKTTFIYVTHDQVEAMTLGTRVVVMRLGEIMQIDTPKNLYDYPNNLFVAGFIGTPQMNFFKATLTKNKDMIHIDFKYSDDAIDVPQEVLAKVQPQYFDGVKEIVVGVRCEDLSLDPEVVMKSKQTINVKVSHFEELGSETLIYGDINQEGDGFSETSTRVIIKGRSDYGLKKGEIAKASIDIRKIHMFDAQSENSINPRIPTDNLINGKITKGTLSLGEYNFKLPRVLALKDGEYDIYIPASSLILDAKSDVSLPIVSKEVIGNIQVVGLKVSNQVIFTTLPSDVEVKDALPVRLDYTQIEFRKDGHVEKEAINAFDSINAIFINHETAKRYVGDKYEAVIEERVQNTKDIYEPRLQALKDKYEEEMSACSGVNASEVNAKNKPLMDGKKTELNATLAKMKEEFNAHKKELQVEHQKNNVLVTKQVEEMYAKIREDELNSFEEFKKINKDRDAYRKRAAEIRVFKENFKLEKNNELEKRINSEAMRYESEVNALKGNYKRNVENLKKEYKSFVDKCKQEANPSKILTKNYKKEVKAINAEYNHQMDLAKIIFFFKTGDLLTLSSDAISNKMVQGLGIKVFTKQYLLEIPHDAYIEDSEGLEVEVVEKLDYEYKKYMRCTYHDDAGDINLYLQVDEFKEVGTKMIVRFDVSKIHITEKSMGIKIY